MDPYLVDFYDGWNNKLNNIAGQTLGEVFDQYMTAFVIYNNLYNQVPSANIRLGIPVPQNLNDNKGATDYVVQFLGAANILAALSANDNNADIDAIIFLIQNEEFYINLKYGERQLNHDLLILQHLTDRSVNKQAIAILKVVYYVRCNLFHGHKDFNENQRRLVEPLVRILKTINNLLYNRLQAIP